MTEGMPDTECADCSSLPSGLCARCAPYQGPRLAVNRRWLLLMGNALIEQRLRQTHAKAAPVSEQRAGWLERRTASRKAAKSKRRTAQLVAALA